MTGTFRHVVFGAYTLALLAIHAEAVRNVVQLSQSDATASHLILIPFITMGLLYSCRSALYGAARPTPRAAAWGLGALAALSWIAGGLAASAGPVYGLSAAVAALVVAWVAGFAACYGMGAVRAGLFPLLFLGFVIPIPSTVVHAAELMLKSGSAHVVAALFAVTGTPFHQSGYIFALPEFRIEIADQCSGIRSTLALVMTSLLAGYLYLTSGWKRALVVLVAVPFAILKNGVRIVALSLLAIHVDPSFMTGSLHHEGGIVFFLVGLAVLAPFFAALCASERPQPLTREHS